MCLVIGILPWIMFTFFLRDNARNIKKHKKKTKSLASCLRCGYEVEFNMSYAKEAEKSKIRCSVLYC